MNILYETFRQKYRNISNASLSRRIVFLGLRTKRHHFTKEQNDYLSENICFYTFPELTRTFNEKFNANVSVCSITEQCHYYLNLKRGKNSFSASTLPLGSEVIKNGMIHVKVSETPYDRKSRWKPKHRIVYEEHFGDIPTKSRIIFLDGNKMNLDIDNLYCISDKIHTILNQNGWYVNDRDSMLAKIKYCELFYKLKESEE